MAGPGQALDAAAEQRRQRLLEMMRATEVYYFDIVDGLEEDLKAILKDVVKQMNRDLMSQILELQDRLAIYEGKEGDEGLLELVLRP